MAKSRKRTVEIEAPPPAAPRRDDNIVAPQDVGSTTAATVDRQRIAERAYELYLRRGGGSGRELDDWLTAERELMKSHGDEDRQPE